MARVSLDRTSGDRVLNPSVWLILDECGEAGPQKRGSGHAKGSQIVESAHFGVVDGRAALSFHLPHIVDSKSREQEKILQLDGAGEHNFKRTAIVAMDQGGS